MLGAIFVTLVAGVEVQLMQLHVTAKDPGEFEHTLWFTSLAELYGLALLVAIPLLSGWCVTSLLVRVTGEES